MRVALRFEPAKASRLSWLATRTVTTTLTLGGFALAILVVAAVRTFGFEYFHGDHTALEGLGRLLLGS